MRERLPRLAMADEDRRDFVVEECARNASRAMCDVQAFGRVLLGALVKIALEVGCAVLMSVDLWDEVINDCSMSYGVSCDVPFCHLGSGIEWKRPSGSTGTCTAA